MKIPLHLKELLVDNVLVEGVFTANKIMKIFKHEDGLRRELNKENRLEMFGYDTLGPRDIGEYLLDLINEPNMIFEDTIEIIKSVENSIDQSFIYIDGSMDEIADVMEHMGMQVPESLDMLPLVSELILGVRLLLDIKAVNDDFEGISSNQKVNIAAAKALVTMSKFGVTITLTSLGSLAGGAGGGMIGGVGAIVGAPVGALTGGVAAGYINKRVAPHAQELSYKLLNLQKEDLLYYKNKKRVDDIGRRLLNFREDIERGLTTRGQY